VGTGLLRAFRLIVALLSEVETISPGFAVPDASTTSLVLPADGGLKGAGPDEVPARSQGFGGGLLAAKRKNLIQFPIVLKPSQVMI
jgi:hypothetical protein